MEQQIPVYRDILNQKLALPLVLQYQLDQGRRALNEAAGLIRGAKRVVVCSIGASYAASYSLINQLAAQHIAATLEDAGELLHYMHQAYDASTVFILISRSGETIEIIQLVGLLKGKGATIIGITNVANSYLARECNCLLFLNSPPDHLIAIQTYTATLLVLYLLAELVAGRLDSDSCRRELDTFLRSYIQDSNRYEGISKEWNKHIQTYKSIYLLGRGASQSSACEGQLLFHEMAWQAAAFYNAGHFRHGPWEVMEPGFLGIIFAPGDACYDLNINLALQIARKGGDVKLVTYQVPDHLPKNITAFRLEQSDTCLHSILEIIPVQFFVYEFALWKGHNPGEFRASTPITLTE